MVRLSSEPFYSPIPHCLTERKNRSLGRPNRMQEFGNEFALFIPVSKPVLEQSSFPFQSRESERTLAGGGRFSHSGCDLRRRYRTKVPLLIGEVICQSDWQIRLAK